MKFKDILNEKLYDIYDVLNKLDNEYQPEIDKDKNSANYIVRIFKDVSSKQKIEKILLDIDIEVKKWIDKRTFIVKKVY